MIQELYRWQNILPAAEDNSEQFPLQQWIIYWKKAAPSGAAKHQKKKDQKRIQTYSPINLTNDQSA